MFLNSTILNSTMDGETGKCRGNTMFLGVHFEVGESKIAIALFDPVIEPHSRTALSERIIYRRDHLNAVYVALDHIPYDRRLDQVPVLNPILHSRVLLQ